MEGRAIRFAVRLLGQGAAKCQLGCSGIACSRKRACSTDTSLPYGQGALIADQRRLYFYSVDHNGHLFMADSKHRNFVTAHKDAAFLKFFFSRIRAARPSDPGFAECAAPLHGRFPWVSPCGRELNFIACEDTPIVYDRMERRGDESVLIYAGGQLEIPFDADALMLSSSRGRLYHPHPRCGSALLGSRLTAELASGITVCDQTGQASLTLAGNTNQLKLLS